MSVHTPGDARCRQHTPASFDVSGLRWASVFSRDKRDIVEFLFVGNRDGYRVRMSPRPDDAGSRRFVTLPPTLESSRCAREHVTRFVAEQHLDRARDDLRIIVSELVANAVMHGRAPIALTLAQHDGTVRVEVTDGAADLDAVHLREIDSPTVGGRGLRILSALADAWGIAATAHGKSVWATYVVASAQHE